jgi:hypothetical protein
MTDDYSKKDGTKDIGNITYQQKNILIFPH